MTTRTLDVLFLTNFSSSCQLATTAVERLAEHVRVRLTLLHAAAAGDVGAARARLARFFQGADERMRTRRILHEGSLRGALTALRGRVEPDLVVAPGSRRPWLRLRPSTRAQLVADSPVPVWTVQPGVAAARLGPVRRVGCRLDPTAASQDYLKWAARLAAAAGAELHILHVVPDFFDGALPTAPGPLCEREVADAIRVALGPSDQPHIHVSPGGSSRALRRLVEAAAPDLLVVGPNDAIRSGLFGPQLGGIVGASPRPVLCVGPEVGMRGGALWSRSRRPEEATPAFGW